MHIKNFEFKVAVKDSKAAEEKLLALHPKFIGEDHQVDTYFNVPEGRLKLREGNIENALIWYQREDAASAKLSDILLYSHQNDEALKAILIKLHGIKVIVDKKRRIYFIDNVKFHFDEVQGLGSFIEVEAIDTGKINLDRLKMQCDSYASFFDIAPSQYISNSYSDMLIEKKGS